MEKFIGFQYNAPYYEILPEGGAAKKVIFVIHGYGQLAKYFIRKFAALKNEGWYIVAPQGLSTFYTEGFSGRVGATWMTKEHRLNDIENYISYLVSIYDKVSAGNHFDEAVLLGFSQGAATASRWLAQSATSFDRLILWAGIFPPDLDIKSGKSRLQAVKIDLVTGTKDPFITTERKEELARLINYLEVDCNQHSFNGAHDIEYELLKDLLS